MLQFDQSKEKTAIGEYTMKKFLFITCIIGVLITVLSGCAKKCDLCKNNVAVYKATFQISDNVEYICEDCYKKPYKADSRENYPNGNPWSLWEIEKLS